MKKLIALVLALVLILSMSVCVSAVDQPASMTYYIRLVNYFEDPTLVGFDVCYYIQPTDDPYIDIPDLTDDFINYVVTHWDRTIPTEVDENLFHGYNPGMYGTGNFVVAIVPLWSEASSDPSFFMLNANNGRNGVEFHMYETVTEVHYFEENSGYFNGETTKEDFFVYGYRGEANTTRDVISVDLSWGGMEFVYTAGQTVWNPKTHEYEEVLNADGSSASGWSVKEGSSNHIAITNHSNVPVEAALTFTSAEGKNIFGSFGNSSLYCPSAEETYNSPEKTPAAITEFNITRGEIDEETEGDLGTITITISKRVEQ